MAGDGLGRATSGSSPRVRRTRRLLYKSFIFHRFISAGAENTFKALKKEIRIAVHLRGCGEHQQRCQIRQSPSGSSPRVRRTPTERCTAGLETGSSPRVRRTHLSPLEKSGLRRFISAGAENTHLAAAHDCQAPVHLRGCGEHPKAVVVNIFASGSSPRVRRTQWHLVGTALQARFISAGAENTAAALRRHYAIPVHLRGCGEHLWVKQLTECSSGSSPRVRRTRFSRAAAIAQLRFISAGAENTPK